MFRKRKTETAPSALWSEPADWLGERGIYAELSINFQYGTRAGLKHAGGTPEGN
jgi:hypothetical protein